LKKIAVALPETDPQSLDAESIMPRFAIALHGGAGKILRSGFGPEREAEYCAALGKALSAGHDILSKDGSSMDAVIAAVQLLEECPLFNAGIGAAFTHAGTHELDASVMDGATLNAGAVAAVSNVKSPIALARMVMEQSAYVMMQSKGAEEFAAAQGLEIVKPDYFHTEHRLRQLRLLQESGDDAYLLEYPQDEKLGTVGVVALDTDGNLAAGTSTGGTTNKQWGRVGDTPIIGAGTYASNQSCAVSSTGTGEHFIRATVARNISAMMEYAGLSLDEATERAIMDQLTGIGGEGGVVAVDKDGNIALRFNTAGMYRGAWAEGGEPFVGMFGDQEQ
jgi:L-asparaginase / beta-aspartyl-peptidase